MNQTIFAYDNGTPIWFYVDAEELGHLINQILVSISSCVAPRGVIEPLILRTTASWGEVLTLV